MYLSSISNNLESENRWRQRKPLSGKELWTSSAKREVKRDVRKDVNADERTKKIKILYNLTVGGNPDKWVFSRKRRFSRVSTQEHIYLKKEAHR